MRQKYDMTPAPDPSEGLEAVTEALEGLKTALQTIPTLDAYSAFMLLSGDTNRSAAVTLRRLAVSVENLAVRTLEEGRITGRVPSPSVLTASEGVAAYPGVRRKGAAAESAAAGDAAAAPAAAATSARRPASLDSARARPSEMPLQSAYRARARSRLPAG